MPTVVEELILAIKYDVDSTELKEARAEASKLAKEFGELFDKAADDAEEAADDSADAHKKAAKETSEVWTGALRRIGERLTDFATSGAKAIAGFVAESFADVRELDNFAIAVGTTGEELSELIQGFQTGGLRVEADNTREAIKTLRENLGELARVGSGPALDSLGSLGLSLQEIDGLSAKEQLKVLADAFQGAESESKALSIAIELMGEDGRALLPALLDGADGVDQYAQSARDAGRVIDQETIVATRDLDAALQDAKGALSGVALEILQALMPQIQDAASGTSDWIDENRELIDQDLPEAAAAIASGIGEIVSALAEAVRLFNAARQAGVQFANELSDASIRTDIRRAGLSADSEAAAGQTVGTRGIAGVSGDSPEIEAARARAQAQSDSREAADALLALSAQNIAENDERLALQRDIDQRELIAERASRGAAFNQDERDAKNGKSKGRGGRSRSGVSADDLQQVEFTGIADELRELGDRFAAHPKALEAALESAARSFGRGASDSVARKAGLGTLGGLIGQDLTKQVSTDPLAEIFGTAGLPAASPADITGGKAPQVLSATINNTFSITQQFDISAADRPDLIPQDVTSAVRQLFETEVQKISHYTGNPFVR